MSAASREATSPLEQEMTSTETSGLATRGVPKWLTSQSARDWTSAPELVRISIVSR